MNYSDFKITLDIQKVTSQAMLPVKVGDSTRRIIVSLAENGKPYQITEECYAVFSATKPDGETIFNHCYINNNQIIYNITPQTTAAEGLVDANIILYGGNEEVIASPRFTILVDETVCSAEELASTSEYSALTELVSQCQELLNTDSEGGGEVQGISGEVSIEDLPIGMSYAEEDASLRYLFDPEMGEYSTLSVASGSCIFKTVGQIEDSNGETMIDGAITVYVISRYHYSYDDYGNKSTIVMTKIVPHYDNQYKMSYSISRVEDKVEVISSIPDDPDYLSIHPNHVPSVGAVINYVAKNASGSNGGTSTGMTELNCWSGNLDDLALGIYYVIDGASFNYLDSNGELTTTSVSNGATMIVGRKMDWNAESGYKNVATVFEPDGYRYLG